MATRQYGRGTRTNEEREAEEHALDSVLDAQNWQRARRRDRAGGGGGRHESAAYSGDPADCMAGALKDCLGPDAVAEIREAVRGRVRAGIEDQAVAAQCAWFAEELAKILGV